MTLKITVPHAELILQDEIRRSEDARYDHRLHAVLLVANGISCPEAARVLGDSERAVRYWIQRFNEMGLQGLVETEKTGRPGRLSEKQMEKIDKVLRQTPRDIGLSTGIWDGKTLSVYIKRDFKISIGVRQCQRLFTALGFRLRKPRPIIAHADPVAQRQFKKRSES